MTQPRPNGGPADTAIPQSLADSLISSVPTEVLAPYTALIGVIVALVAEPDDYLPLRWVVYGLTAGLVAVAVTVVYRHKNLTSSARRVPREEVVIAVLAFAVWGLVMPGSPLQATVHPATARAVTTAVVAFGGAALLALIGTTLTRTAAKPTRR